MASTPPRPARAAETAKFELGAEHESCTDDGREVVPGIGEIGRSRCAAARRSATTRTRPSRRGRSSTIDGERYSIPGDYATVEADGTVTLLGRGSQCINTGGEKVYPEEVEEA